MAEPTQIAFRTVRDIGLLNAAPVYDAPGGFERPVNPHLRCSAYSPDGRFFAWASPDQVTVVDPSIGSTVTTLPATDVHELGFSPLGTFIITWQRPTKDESGNATKNLKVWRTVEEPGVERTVVGQFVQKSQTGWNLQYTADEHYCARVVTNEVQFYESGDLGTVWNKLRVEGVTDFAVAPGDEQVVAVFVPERKGQPAAVKVFKVPHFEQSVSQKTFFKGDKVQLKWNDLGTSIIVLAQTDVDKSNRSYYGETNMYVLSAHGGFDSRIQLDKEGPIHDVTWSPSSKQFGVVYGYMPAKTTIFDTKANPVHNFNLAPRNTILFSPHGRFVLVAGFGNLAGQLDIYDLEHDYAKVCTIEASNASICEWSPDGTHILTATTSPRLRVDNGVRMWHVGGGLVYNQDIDELYSVFWRPQSIAKHPLPADPLSDVPVPHASATAYLGTVKTPSKPAGAYRPPGARGTSTPLHFKREDQGGAAYVNNGAAGATTVNGAGRGRRNVPGAEPTSSPLPPGAAPGGGVSLTMPEDDSGLSKAALKNKKKREAKKAKDAAPPAEEEKEKEKDKKPGAHKGHNKHLSVDNSNPPHRTHSPSSSQGGQHHRNRSRDNQRRNRSRDNRSRSRTPNRAVAPQPAPLDTSTPAAPLSLEDGTPASASPHDKKVRALLKKLRAIDELKLRQAAGEKLELSQVSKIGTEDSVRRELEGLGVAG